MKPELRKTFCNSPSTKKALSSVFDELVSKNAQNGLALRFIYVLCVRECNGQFKDSHAVITKVWAVEHHHLDWGIDLSLPNSGSSGFSRSLFSAVTFNVLKFLASDKRELDT